MKKLLLIILSLNLILLAGCGQSNEKTISFDNFSMTLNNSFSEIDNSLVSNKQIVNNIIKSYKVSNQDGYDENMVITKSDLKRNYSIEDVVSVNMEKLKTQLSGFNLIETKSLDFSCKGNTIKGSYMTFTLPKTIGGKETYRLSQYYFVYENKNYIISYSTQNSDVKDFVGYLKTIECK